MNNNDGLFLDFFSLKCLLQVETGACPTTYIKSGKEESLWDEMLWNGMMPILRTPNDHLITFVIT